MPTPSPPASPASPASPRMRTARLLWGAISLSTVLIAGVYAYLLTHEGIRVRRPPNPDMLGVMAAVATGVGLLSVFFPRALYRRAARMVLDEAKDRSRPAMLAALFPVFQTPLVLSLALSEAISVIGLSLGMSGFSAEQCAPFFAVGTVFALARFPSESAVLAPIEDELR